MSDNRGRFITVEGGEGVGKSTNIETIEGFLQGRNIDYIKTREPGGTVVAERIRELLLDSQNEDMDATCELLLIFAARAQHLAQLIRPALNSGQWVLCDRFTDATYAYQGAGRNLDNRLIRKLESIVQDGIRPDLTIILDLDPETGLQRARSRGVLDRFEREHLAFFEAVRHCYLEIARSDPERCSVLDASLSIDEVTANLIKTLEARLGKFV